MGCARPASAASRGRGVAAVATAVGVGGAHQGRAAVGMVPRPCASQQTVTEEAAKGAGGTGEGACSGSRSGRACSTGATRCGRCTSVDWGLRCPIPPAVCCVYGAQVRTEGADTEAGGVCVCTRVCVSAGAQRPGMPLPLLTRVARPPGPPPAPPLGTPSRGRGPLPSPSSNASGVTLTARSASVERGLHSRRAAPRLCRSPHLRPTKP